MIARRQKLAHGNPSQCFSHWQLWFVWYLLLAEIYSDVTNSWFRIYPSWRINILEPQKYLAALFSFTFSLKEHMQALFLWHWLLILLCRNLHLQLLIFCDKCLFSCLVGRGYTMYRLPIQWMYRSVVFLNNYSTQWFMRHCQLCVCIHINMGVFINNFLQYIVLVHEW